MIEVTEAVLRKDAYLLYIHTPFCGTCHLARAILEEIEATFKKDVFYEMNASLYTDYMMTHKVESVPTLLIKDEGEVKRKIYTFYSTPNIISELIPYQSLLLEELK